MLAEMLPKCIKVYVFYCFPRWRAHSISTSAHDILMYLHPQASTKGFQEKNPRRIGDCSQHSYTVDPSEKSLVEPIN